MIGKIKFNEKLSKVLRRDNAQQKGITINMKYYKKNKRGSLVTALSLHDQETKK